MNEKVLKTLEYYKIIKMLENQAGSEPGKKLCHALVPSADIHKIKENQKQTGDALSRIWQKGNLSFSGIHNIGESIKRLEIGSTLGTGELLRIDSLLKVALRVKTFSRRDDEAERDSLDDMFETIEPLTNLKNDIERCIISEDEIADDASANLKNIRRQMKWIPVGQRYTCSIIYSYFKYKFKELTTIFGEQSKKGEYTIVTVCNGQYYGGGHRIAPHALIDDGYFEIYMVDKMPKILIPGLLLKLKNGRHEKSKRVVRYTDKGF